MGMAWVKYYCRYICVICSFIFKFVSFTFVMALRSLLLFVSVFGLHSIYTFYTGLGPPSKKIWVFNWIPLDSMKTKISKKLKLIFEKYWVFNGDREKVKNSWKFPTLTTAHFPLQYLLVHIVFAFLLSTISFRSFARLIHSLLSFFVFQASFNIKLIVNICLFLSYFIRYIIVFAIHQPTLSAVENYTVYASYI